MIFWKISVFSIAFSTFFQYSVFKYHIDEICQLDNVTQTQRGNEGVKLLSSIFEYFEKVSNRGDDHLINMFSITALETLGNDKKILSIAQTYMGAKTKSLQREADRKIGRDI